MENLERLLPLVGVPLSYLLLYTVIFLVAKSVLAMLVKYSMNNEVGKEQNCAVGVAYSGYLIAVTIVFIGALAGPTHGLRADLLNVTVYSILGILFLLISRIVNDKLILSQFCNYKELVDDRNVGTGAVIFGSYVASGLIVAGSIHGEGGGVVTASVFFLLGQVSLVAFSKIYNLITPYDVHDEIEKDNFAVGIAFGGTLIALGIILMNGVSGGFVSWGHNLIRFALFSVGAFLLLPLFRLFMDKVLVSSYDLNRELHKGANVAAGLLEAVMVVCFAVVASFAL